MTITLNRSSALSALSRSSVSGRWFRHARFRRPPRYRRDMVAQFVGPSASAGAHSAHGASGCRGGVTLKASSFFPQFCRQKCGAQTPRIKGSSGPAHDRSKAPRKRAAGPSCQPQLPHLGLAPRSFANQLVHDFEHREFLLCFGSRDGALGPVHRTTLTDPAISQTRLSKRLLALGILVNPDDQSLCERPPNRIIQFFNVSHSLPE
jgi:hypothetical protein